MAISTSPARIGHAFQHGGPAGEVARRGVDAEVVEYDLVHAFGREHNRALVDALDVLGGDDGVDIDVAEEGDLLLHLLRDEMFAAADQDIGLDTDGAQLLDGVLGRLGLELVGGGDPRNQGDVDEQAIVAPLFMAHLADGFEERQRFDIADRAADLGDDDIDVTRHLLERGLDLIGDMGNHLDGLAQIIPAALARDDLFVDAAAGEVVGLGQPGVGKTLVVAEIEIGLGAVVGDEDLAMLERAHGAGIDVEVGVELLTRDLESAAFQKTPDTGGGDALPQRRNHAAGNENEFSHALSPQVWKRQITV